MMKKERERIFPAPAARFSNVPKRQQGHGSSFETWQLFYLSLYLEDEKKKAAFPNKRIIASRTAFRPDKLPGLSRNRPLVFEIALILIESS